MSKLGINEHDCIRFYPAVDTWHSSQRCSAYPLLRKRQKYVLLVYYSNERQERITQGRAAISSFTRDVQLFLLTSPPPLLTLDLHNQQQCLSLSPYHATEVSNGWMRWRGVLGAGGTQITSFDPAMNAFSSYIFSSYASFFLL